MGFLKAFVTWVDRISLTVGQWVAYSMLILMVTSSIEIVSRYFFNKPTIWAYEFGQMLFGSYFLLVGAMALRNREHVGMDILLTRLSPRKQALMNAITFVFTALFCSVMVWKGWQFASLSIRNLEHSTSVWGPPIYPYKLMLPLGSLLLLLQAASNFIKDLTFFMTGNPLLEEE